jgi:hypothetical protein
LGFRFVESQVRYYQLTVAPASVDLTFACTTFAGSASMFISNTAQPVPSNALTFQWSAPYSNPNKRVTINLAQPGLVLVDGISRLRLGLDSCRHSQNLHSYLILALLVSYSFSHTCSRMSQG